MSISDHPDRSAITDEVHARPVEILPEACRIRRLVFVLPAKVGMTAATFQRLLDFCVQRQLPRPTPGSRQHTFAAGARHCTWEFHTEFVTVTWRSDLADRESFPESVGLEALEDGLLIGAMRIDVIADATIPERLLPGFNLPSLCLADVEGGRAQVATDLVPDADKFVRYELAAGNLTVLRRSIIARRLLEVETYRTMALLGLPLARAISPELRTIEIELASSLERVSNVSTPAMAQQALDSLHSLSVKSGQLAERFSYRFAASLAYGQILRQRLAGLRESATIRGSTLTHCLGNRVEPALATCEATEKRLVVLSGKLERTIGLLHVRIGLDMQVQSAAVLDSIAKTAKSQFMLQRNVEGLSTIAISYYVIGILGYALAAPLEHWHWEKTVVLSIAAPLVLTAVWPVMRLLGRSHGK